MVCVKSFDIFENFSRKFRFLKFLKILIQTGFGPIVRWFRDCCNLICAKKMLLFFYPVLCKPCKWCAIKTIYKQKDVHTELFKADSFAGKYNITECSVCFSCCGVSELKYFWQITYQILQIIWRAQAIKELFNYLICNFTKSSIF